MHLAIIADSFPPLRTSAALQLKDLAREFVLKGHEITLILPHTAPDSLKVPWRLEDYDGLRVLRLKAFRTKGIGYIRRTLAELAMPFSMLWNYRKSPLAKECWGGVVWYSPSIFHGPMVSALKKSSRCKSYLIIRDIFPEWAVDIGIMGRGLSYRFFDLVARYQYSIADVIGVQTSGDRTYFESWVKQSGRNLEVLHNWLGKPAQNRCSIRVNETFLSNRNIFIYAGNMGVSQNIDIILDLAESLRERLDVGFLFVGSGSDASRLKRSAQVRKLGNVLFFDEIHPDEIPDLYDQCAAGIVVLDPRHKSHNIPGKFLSYMQCGLPVLAAINAGNDLVQLIRHEQVGEVCEGHQLKELVRLADVLLAKIADGFDFSDRCTRLFERDFSVEHAVEQIVASLSK